MSTDLSPAEPALLTEYAFDLPRGFVDGSGTVHRSGVMRLATARDEILPLRDPRVRDNDAYLTVLLLARVVTELGDLPEVTPATIEGLFAPDLAFLQDLYRRINQEGHTHVPVHCPTCNSEFSVDVSGGASGGIVTSDPDRLLDEVAYLAETFGWSLDSLLDLEHADRRHFIAFCTREPEAPAHPDRAW